MQEGGGANDGEAWNCFDEGRWKEGGNGTEGGEERVIAKVQTDGSRMQM